MATSRINEARLRLIHKRQRTDAWGKDYHAAIWATPKEAPGISTGTILHSQKLGGRPMHTLSRPETWAALLALYNPEVWDIHEQKMLFPGPRAHFLDGHSRCVGQIFKPLRGTLAVAEEMGCLSKHPRCRVQLSDQIAWAPFPYIGDLLLFMEKQGSVYAVNWTVKDKTADFHRRGPRSGKPRVAEVELVAMQRHALEARYYQDAGIPTYQVAGQHIDLDLRANLYQLFLSHAEPRPVSEPCFKELCHHFNQLVGSPTPAYKAIHQVALHLGLTPTAVKNLVEQGIWQRVIQVDLFKPILWDRPLKPQLRDPLEVYQDWFKVGL
jgi:hypothetical protein